MTILGHMAFQQGDVFEVRFVADVKHVADDRDASQQRIDGGIR